MPKSEKQKLKLLYIIKMLHEKSDENHPLSMEEIISRLERVGINAERKSIYNDMNALRDFGYDIMLTRGKNGGYFLASRNFEIPELKVLVDAVQASRFITAKKSKQLIDKITQLAGEYEAKSLNREVYVMNRVKTENEAIYYNVDEIYRAIDLNVQITFKYLEYSIDKKTRFKRGGKLYQLSPRALAWRDENYYLIAYDAEEDRMKNYRVDKIQNIAITDKPRIMKEEYRNFDVAAYCNQSFGMFSGEEKTITVRFPERLVGVVIDRFGKEVTIHSTADGEFTARLKVAVSQQLFGWLTGLGPEVKIESPNSVVEEYTNYIDNIIQTYKM